MAQVADFYSNGPYLHKNPKADFFSGKDVRDNFEPLVAPLSLGTLSNVALINTIAELQQRANQAQAYEQQFFVTLVGQPMTTDQFSDQYMIPSRLKDYEEARKLYLAEGTISQKIEIILRNPAYYKIFAPEMDSAVANLDARLNVLFEQEAVEIINEYREELESDNMIGEVADFLAKSLQGSFPKKITIGDNTRIKINNHLMFKDKEIEELFKRRLRARYKDSASKFMSERKVQNVRKEFIKQLRGRDFEKIATSITRRINYALKQNLKDADFEGGQKEKEFYIRYITTETKQFLLNKIHEDKGAFYFNISNTVGDWDEFTREMSFKPLFNDVDLTKEVPVFVKDLVSRMGREHVIVPGADGSQPAGSDLRIGDFLFQLKGTKADVPGLKGSISNYTIMRSPKTLVDLIAEASTAQISIPNLKEVLYVLVNRLHRDETDSLAQLANFLINVAVEIYIRSDTVRSGLGLKTGSFPKPGQPMGGFADQTVPQNHFWIVNNRLVGVSSFLQSACNALIGLSNSPSWHGSGSFFINTSPVEDKSLFFDKRIQSRSNTRYSAGDKYGEPVLAVGRAQGESMYGTIQLKEITMLRSFSTKLSQL